MKKTLYFKVVKMNEKTASLGNHCNNCVGVS